MLTLFLFGSIGFWVLLFVSFCSIVALIENENEGWADVVFVATMFALYKLGCQVEMKTIFTWIAQNWSYSLLLFVGYFVAGTLYSIVKWYLHLIDLSNKKLHDPYVNASERKFQASENKVLITHWMIYWPISGIWTLICNPIVKIFNRIFYKLENFYQKIGDKIFNEMEAKLSNKKK